MGGVGGERVGWMYHGCADSSVRVWSQSWGGNYNCRHSLPPHTPSLLCNMSITLHGISNCVMPVLVHPFHLFVSGAQGQTLVLPIIMGVANYNGCGIQQT